MKSSIHMKASVAGIILHNARENFSHSVVFKDEKNELWNDSKTAFKLFRDELEVRTKAYTKRTNQKLQKNTATGISAVVNLEKHHTLEDLESIKIYLEKEFGTKVFQMAIHRDEGKLVNKENPNLTLISGKTFFLNPKDEKLYGEKDFKNLINMKEWNIEKNYHAHIEMLGIDEDGNSLRKKMNIYKLSKLQDFVAESLNMERGNNNVVTNEKGGVKRKDTKFKRKDPKRLKDDAEVLNDFAKASFEDQQKLIKKANKIISRVIAEKEKLKEELEELKSKVKNMREEFKENDAKRKEHAELDALNKQLQIDLKNKSITIKQAMQKIEDLKEQLFNPDFKTDSGKKILNTDAVKYLVNVNQELEKRIKDLEKNLNQEHSITNPTFQQKILFEKYQNLIKTDLKGFFIDTKNDETKIQNKAKNIDIVDKGNSIISNSNGAKNLEQRVTIMIDIAIAKGWDIEKLNIKGEDSFLIEAKRQINERLLLKELNSYKTNLNALQEQNEQLANEIITLNAKVSSSSNMSELEDLKNKNKEIERYLNASLLVINSKNKELNAKEGKEVYSTNLKKSDLNPLVMAEVKKEFEKKNKIPNKRDINFQREI